MMITTKGHSLQMVSIQQEAAIKVTHLDWQTHTPIGCDGVTASNSSDSSKINLTVLA